jgi:hypothetical protein
MKYVYINLKSKKTLIKNADVYYNLTEIIDL